MLCANDYVMCQCLRPHIHTYEPSHEPPYCVSIAYAKKQKKYQTKKEIPLKAPPLYAIKLRKSLLRDDLSHLKNLV